MTTEEDDSLRSISISPRERLAHIEEALERIDMKLDLRFGMVENRLTKVENTQAGQASIAELVEKAKILAEAESAKAAGLAKEATDTAASLAKDAASKAATLAEGQKEIDEVVIGLRKEVEAFGRKLSVYAGVGTGAVFVSGVIGYFINR